MPASSSDLFPDFQRTGAHIANIPCNDASCEQVLDVLARWNNPGTGLGETTSRFIANYNLALPRPGLMNHPGRILYRNIKSMFGASDRYILNKKHWKKITVDPRWLSPITEIPYSFADRPLHRRLKGCTVGQERTRIGLSNINSFLMHSAVLHTTNLILAATGEAATEQEVEAFIGSSGFVRPIPQDVDWHAAAASPRARRIAVWTLATACSMWGLDFVESFLQFCTSALVGSVCGVTRQQCKEGFAACVAIATIGRARASHGGQPISPAELATCERALWVLDVLERACAVANGTLWASRYIFKVQGERVSVKACNRWESPIVPDLTPAHNLFVVGYRCSDSKKDNGDGTEGTPCPARWIAVTRLDELGDQLGDRRLRVTLTHGNTPAIENVLASLEKKGLWAYVQGPEECLNCACKRALRHGFPVIVDGPHGMQRTRRSSELGLSAIHFSLLLFSFFTFFSASWAGPVSTQGPSSSANSIFKPEATCERFPLPTRASALSRGAIISVVRAAGSVIMTILTIRTGKQFVRRTSFNLVTSIATTLLAGFAGWVITPGCAGFKTGAVLKGLITAAVNRLAYEAIDILCMVLSFVSIGYALIYNLRNGNPSGLLQPSQLSLILLSLSYLWRWINTGMKQSTSRGVVGPPAPLLGSHVVALGLAVVALVYNRTEDSAGTIASYVSDGSLIGELLMQFFLLI